MDLKNQKRIAAQLLKCSPKRVVFMEDYLEDIKGAITKADLKILINKGGIQKQQVKGVSRARANKALRQKRKGLRKHAGSRKGRSTARLSDKEAWMQRIRAQREILTTLKKGQRITNETFKDLSRKAKGGFFRNRRHIKIYLDEHKLILPKTQSKG